MEYHRTARFVHSAYFITRILVVANAVMERKTICLDKIFFVLVLEQFMLPNLIGSLCMVENSSLWLWVCSLRPCLKADCFTNEFNEKLMADSL